MEPDETKSRGHGDKKPKLRERFIMALLENTTLESAAAAVKIGRTTAFRWMQDPDVIQRFAEVRRQSIQHAMFRLQAAAGQSVACLCEVQQTGETESARVTASRVILDMALRSVELGDILERLEKLEHIAKNNWKGAGSGPADQKPTQPPGRVNGRA
jgi:hypothetical protein